MIVARAVYRDGERVAEPDSISAMASRCRNGGGMAWIGLYKPSREEFEEVTREFDLHELAIDDAVNAHQRAKLERFGDTLFCVLRPARYIDETETVEFGEIHVFAGPEFVITVRHGEMPRPRRRAPRPRGDGRTCSGEGRSRSCTRSWIASSTTTGPWSPALENDIDEIEDDVFGTETSADVSRRIYELTREVIAFQRAIKPLVPMLERLMAAPGVDDEERRYLRDVLDHALQARGLRGRLPRAAPEHPQHQPHAGDEGPQRGLLPPERAGQEDLGLGGDPLRARRSWGRSTA